MHTNLVTLSTGRQVWLIENALPDNWLKHVHNICDSYHVTSPRWIQPQWCIDSGNRPRYIFDNQGDEWLLCETFIRSREFLYPVEKLTAHSLTVTNMTLWADFKGFGSLGPHKEQGGGYMMQIYIAKDLHSYGGTTIYNDQSEILIQLPYRDTFAWFFNGQEIMHGRHHDVASNIQRFTLQIWMDKLNY
jgi:hypothetical protein